MLDPSVTHIYGDMSLRQYLEIHKYSKSFIDNYIVPMCAAVWSVPNAQVCGRILDIRLAAPDADL